MLSAVAANCLVGLSTGRSSAAFRELNENSLSSPRRGRRVVGVRAELGSGHHGVIPHTFISAWRSSSASAKMAAMGTGVTFSENPFPMLAVLLNRVGALSGFLNIHAE